MISSLSSLADRNFVLGFLLPVIIAALVTCGLFQDVPQVAAIWKTIMDADGFAKLTVLVLSLWTIAIFLLTINHALYQFLEGYWGPFKYFSLFLTRQQKAFDEALAERARLEGLADASEKADDDYIKATREFRKAFPGKREWVLPTRFGNVLRAFETYSLDVYGVDSIPGWLRLSGVIAESFTKLVDNARAEIDFLLNSCLLFAIIGIVTLGAAVNSAVNSWLLPAEAHGIAWWHLIAAPAAGVVSLACYRFAVMRAPAWGDLVRSAFDLYLPSLAKQMGYDLPETPEGRSDFWDALNSMFLYNEPVDVKAWQAEPKRPAQEPQPETHLTIIASIDSLEI